MNKYFAETLTNVLEETSTNMGNAMTLDHLAKNGTVTLEEAEFFHNLCTDVITEAAEDFIPDTLDVPEPQAEVAPEAVAGEGEIFYDKAGNAFMFSGGQMMPVDETEMGDPEAEEQPEVEPEPAQAEGEVPAQFAEGTQVAPEAEPAKIEEGTQVAVAAEPEAVLEEGTVVADEPVEGAPEAVLEEGTVVADEPSAELLEENSSNVVARILANLK